MTTISLQKYIQGQITDKLVLEKKAVNLKGFTNITYSREEVRVENFFKGGASLKDVSYRRNNTSLLSSVNTYPLKDHVFLEMIGNEYWISSTNSRVGLEYQGTIFNWWLKFIKTAVLPQAEPLLIYGLSQDSMSTLTPMDEERRNRRIIIVRLLMFLSLYQYFKIWCKNKNASITS